MIILIDNGHGVNTSGKCSPDGKFREYRYAREIADEVMKRLRAQGYDARRIVEEDGDISLTQRAARVNAICDKFGRKNVLLVSIHNDAAGADGKWHDARGFSVRVSPQGSDASRRLAQCLYDAATQRGNAVTGNRSVPPGRYWPQSLYILNATKCPAVLTENLFQDNRQDVDFLLSAEGRDAIAGLHIEGIINYINGFEQ
jgi:hypothetical protein